ncbi:MAG: hypothetical protein Q4G25_10290 [Paracoccus sp. (in: a-proteobacteria)]|nr:hypothetical protein [Paracoccus sp. (in: a-proteobacteria)]
MTRRTLSLAALGLSLAVLGGCGLLRGDTSIVSREDAAARAAAEAAAGQPAAGIDADTAPAPAPAVAPAGSGGGVLQGGGQSVAALDTTTAAERAAATAPATGGGRLGTTVASLGDATQGGFWLKTPLVNAQGKGRVVNPASGKSANVDLMPLSGGGAGSQISLAAMQALGLSLIDLPTLEVWRN